MSHGHPLHMVRVPSSHGDWISEDCIPRWGEDRTEGQRVCAQRDSILCTEAVTKSYLGTRERQTDSIS